MKFTTTKKSARDEQKQLKQRDETSDPRFAEIQDEFASTLEQLGKVQSRTRDLFHFTAAAFLPAILESGITRGFVPVDLTRPYREQPQAACLTGNGDLFNQSWNQWDQLFPDNDQMEKRKIRLTVHVPEGSLMPFSELQAKYQIDDPHIRLLDRMNQRNHWYFAFSGLPPDAIVKVEVLNGIVYEEVSGDELDGYVAEIKEEFEAKLEFNESEDPFLSGARFYSLKPGVTSSWLFDAAHFDDVLAALLPESAGSE